MIITEEMEATFDKDINRHRNLIKGFMEKIIKDDRFKIYAIPLLKSCDIHDYSKFSPDIYNAYVLYNWSFRDKDIVKGYENEISAALQKHFKSEPHHPEYHKDYQMDDLSIAEMVCDWCSISVIRGNNAKSPLIWAKKTINRKWFFTKEQEDLIYDLLKKYGSKI